MTYQPIDSYGMVGDLRTIALIGPNGSVDFMCFPNFDSPTVFAALLDDEHGGRFKIAPVGAEEIRVNQLYVPDTNVLVTQFLSEKQGIAEITDFMPVLDRGHPHRVIRRLTQLRGSMDFELRCAPRFDYARSSHSAVLEDDWTVQFTPERDDLQPLRLRSLDRSVKLTVDGKDATATTTLKPNQQVDFVFDAGPDRHSQAIEEGYVEQSLTETLAYWRDWVRLGTYPKRWREMVVRSALTMKMLCSSETGGIAAAATFGLPEEIGGGRNWDYRFTWVRDASLTATSLTTLGFTHEMEAYIGWLTERYKQSDDDGSLQIMYGIDGRKDLTEQVLEGLAGYKDSAPVRIGNGAYDQLQIDIYGELMIAVDAYDERCTPISHDLWQYVTHSVNWTCTNWDRKDEGVWEVRGGPRKFLYSRLMSWVAVDRAVRIAERRGRPAPLDEWREVRDTIYTEVFTTFWNDEMQAFVQYENASTLDASCLLMPIVGLVSPTDPRWLSTLEQIGEKLVEGAFVYRYRTEAGESALDGLSGAEGTFTMCSFWYAECLARAGQLDRARLLFEKLQGFSSSLGLYSEELSAGGVALGNYPQNFTHLGVVQTALFLDAALEASGVHH